MLKSTALTTLVVAALSPLAVMADSPHWTFVEASYVASESSGNNSPEPDGFEIAGSYAVGDWAFVDLSYSEEEDTSNFNSSFLGKGKFDLTLERLSVGAGAKWGVLESTDLYGRVAFEDWTLDQKIKIDGNSVSDDASESGYSVSGGVRSILWEALELRAEVNYVDIDDIMDGETGYGLGVYYTFAKLFTFGASYEDLDDFETYKATLRYQF
jgi:hypothetical protein